MERKEKEAILQFMRLSLRSCHPHYHEYPFAGMRQCYESFGEESEQFNNFAPYLQEAFFMNMAIEKLEESS